MEYTDQTKTKGQAKTRWTMDKAHSLVHFKARHMVIANVAGQFRKFKAEVEADNADLETVKIRFTADVSSIDTGNAERDTHLKSLDFFYAEKYPEIEFISVSMKRLTDEKYKLNGMLTIRGISKAVELDVEYGGLVQDPWKNWKSGFTVTGKVSRKEYELSWNATNETGSAVIGDEVKIECNIEFIKGQAD